MQCKDSTYFKDEEWEVLSTGETDNVGEGDESAGFEDKADGQPQPNVYRCNCLEKHASDGGLCGCVACLENNDIGREDEFGLQRSDNATQDLETAVDQNHDHRSHDSSMDYRKSSKAPPKKPETSGTHSLRLDELPGHQRMRRRLQLV